MILFVKYNFHYDFTTLNSLAQPECYINYWNGNHNTDNKSNDIILCSMKNDLNTSNMSPIKFQIRKGGSKETFSLLYIFLSLSFLESEFWYNRNPESKKKKPKDIIPIQSSVLLAIA